VTEIFRTPDDRFHGLADFDFQPQYRVLNDLRLAHIDAGYGKPVVFLHGEPTWSFLWRKVIPPVLESGFRCIAPDLPGFGRSDKPLDVDWYTYDRHTEAIAHLFEDLDLHEATIVVHDWGGPIGLRIAVEQAERIDRIVILDSGLITGRQKMSDAWIAFRNFVEATPDLPISMLLRGGCKTDPGDEIAKAYDAPFPNAASKAGARAFPLILPMTPDAPGAQTGRRVLAALKMDNRDTLMLWADSDPFITLATGNRFAEAIGVKPPEIIENASHFLQEDQGAEVGRRIAEWLTCNKGS